jgi:hypothetical protein
MIGKINYQKGKKRGEMVAGAIALEGHSSKSRKVG